MDEPVPVRRAVIGCLALAVLGIVAVVLVRPAIFVFAEPRDDSAVVLGTTAIVSQGPVIRDVVMARSRGWAGEVDAGGGRVQLRLIVAAGRFGAVTVVAGASPMTDDCPVEIGADRLTDCEGRAWTFGGDPLDPTDEPLDRFPVTIEDGSVKVDLTRPLDG
ncbi:MAG TPA: hypothetical protein VI277_09720 [Candidatus Limnocylindria bacterium]